MSVGMSVLKPDIDMTAGSVCRNLSVVMAQVGTLQAFLAAKTEADLVALGYTTGEVAVLKSAFARLDVLRQIYEGKVAQGATPEDFTTFPRQLWGLKV